MATQIRLKQNKLKFSEKKKRDNKKIAAEIWKNSGEWFEYYNDNITKHREDFDFCYADDGQWTSTELTEAEEMKKFGKTKQTYNMMVKIINTLVGEYSETDPELKVRNTDTAEITQELTKKINIMTGLLRNISVKSRYDEVKKAAFKAAIGGGFGAYAITVEKEKRIGFNLVPRYKSINDPTTCFWDRTAQDTDKGDGWFAGRCYIWKKEKLRRKYPGVEISNSNECMHGFDSFTWLTDDDIIIADYWKKIPFKRHIAQLSDERIVDFEEAEKIVAASRRNKLSPINLTILKDEIVDDFKIHFYRAAGNNILEDNEWQGTILPVIFQGGVIVKYRGREYAFSLIRWLKAAQKSYNFARNETLWRLKLLRHEKWLVEDENIEGKTQEEIWKNAHLPRSALVFKRAKSGHIPVRIPPGEIPQSLAVETQQSFNDMQQILGRFDANQGAPSNEKSGLAILRRQTAGNLSVKPFFDSAESAEQSGANAILDLIPKVIDNNRLIQTTDEDGNQTNVRVNDGSGIDLTEGDFEVSVTVGPNFETQKADAVGLLMEAYRSNPDLAKVSSDIFAKNLDMKGASLLADRAKTYLQPQITADEAQNLSQQAIIQKNQQSQAQAQQAQQQFMLQNMQLDQMVKQSKMQDDKIKAMSNQLVALADMMNAKTNQAKAVQAGVIAQQRADAEITKAIEEERTARLKLLKEAGEGAQADQSQLFR
jgi:hypothetical protein